MVSGRASITRGDRNTMMVTLRHSFNKIQMQAAVVINRRALRHNLQRLRELACQ